MPKVKTKFLKGKEVKVGDRLWHISEGWVTVYDQSPKVDPESFGRMSSGRIRVDNGCSLIEARKENLFWEEQNDCKDSD